MRNKSRYSRVRVGKVGDRVETWPGRKQGRVFLYCIFVSHGHPWLRISLPVGTRLMFDADVEFRDYTTIPSGPVGTMLKDATIVPLSSDVKSNKTPDPFRLALMTEGAKWPIALDYIRARQIATVVSLPT